MSNERILVIKLSALGDFVQSLGPMAAIRRHHKDAHITLLTTKPFREMAEKAGYFDEIWIDQRPKWWQLSLWADLSRRLNSAGLTRVYDLQNNDRTSFYFKLLGGAKKPEWVGVAKGASHCNDSPARTAGHAFDGHVQTLALAGITDVQVDDFAWVKEDLSAFALQKPYVLLVPGCAPQHPHKRWPGEYYAAFAKEIAAKGFQPVLIGTASEAEITGQIAKDVPQSLDLTGQTNLFQIAALARDAAFALGNDTGPMHIIGATGCPSLALFSGKTDPVRCTPKGAHVQALQKEELNNLPPEEVLKHFKPRG